jgi:hypothetical protein
MNSMQTAAFASHHPAMNLSNERHDSRSPLARPPVRGISDFLAIDLLTAHSHLQGHRTLRALGKKCVDWVKYF